MLPRQRQYGIFADDLIYYNQMGGAGISTIGDLLTTAGRKLEDITKALGKAVVNFKLADIGRLTGAIKTKVFILVSKSLDNPRVQRLFIDTFQSPSILKRFPPVILNKLPVETLAKLDVTTLSVKIQDDVLQSLRNINPKLADEIDVFKLNNNLTKLNQQLTDLKNLQIPNTDDLDSIAKIAGDANPGTVSRADNVAEFNPTLKADDELDSLIKSLNDGKANKLPEDGPVKLPEDGAKIATPEQIADLKNISGPELAKTPSGSATDGTLKVETPTTAKIDQAGWLSRNKGKIIVGGVTVGAGIYGGFALDNFLKKNDTQFDIIQMELDKNDPDTSIWFYYSVKAENNFELTTNNWILLEKNDAVPQIPIDKIYKVAEVDNTARKIKILLNKTEMPTSIGHTGSFRYQTTYGNQLIETASDVAKGLGSGATQVATGLLGGILESLGLSKTAFFGGLIGIIVIIVILIVLFMVLKNRSGGE